MLTCTYQTSSLLFLFSILCVKVYSISLDSSDEHRNIKKIAFGSCSKTRYPLHYLQNLIDINPDIWLWTGDTVYGKTKHGTDLTKIEKNYKTLKSHSLYQQFIANNVTIEGVYDDHDIGMNDADNRLSKSIQKAAQHLFLDFLNIDPSSSRRKRNGVYSVHKFGNILIILLDTRTHRSPTVIPSIGKYEYPLLPFIASYIRYLTASFGFTNDYNGTVLGKEQWEWFEDVLQSIHFEGSELVLIVSSTQIFTNNPYFESWGHFPSEKKKLLQLMEKYTQEQHVLFISGDVHHAEFIYGNEHYGPLEVTSSGLTHALNTMSIQRFAAFRIVESYKDMHRTKYLNETVITGYYGRNFGMIDITDANEYRLSIYDAMNGNKVTSVYLNKDKQSSFKQVLKELNEMDIMYFPLKYPFFGLEIIAPIILLLCICIISVIEVKKFKNKATKSKRNKEL